MAPLAGLDWRELARHRIHRAEDRLREGIANTYAQGKHKLNNAGQRMRSTPDWCEGRSRSCTRICASCASRQHLPPAPLPLKDTAISEVEPSPELLWDHGPHSALAPGVCGQNQTELQLGCDHMRGGHCPPNWEGG
ncbi:hypothetical protein HaLaN_24015 [Haematococcus lacustris]|uniref:Uncharacterized protein n=1 Tax=Haematococcus lacustris TaxID=44745 RepID=A0A6A0A2V7_HAELA|nr:hypothetical protein HaLaN_24015 [Haematococcus lacustris]